MCKDQRFDLDLWPWDLKINRKHLLSKGIHCTKFGNFQAKGVKRYWVNIAWSTEQPLDRCKTISPLFKKKKRGHNKNKKRIVVYHVLFFSTISFSTLNVKLTHISNYTYSLLKHYNISIKNLLCFQPLFINQYMAVINK